MSKVIFLFFVQAFAWSQGCTICRCAFNASTIPEIDLTKNDIETKFNGNSFNDKLKESIKFLSSTVDTIINLNNTFESCRKDLKREIKLPEYSDCFDAILDSFSGCSSIINTQLSDFYARSTSSKKLLEEQLVFSEKSFETFAGLKKLLEFIGL